MTTMFEVDADGYRAQMSEMKPGKVVYELVANANDEDSVKEFTVNIRWVDGETAIEYQDNGAGFEKISDVWTLYGHSTRRADPTKSGRFNLGEKEFLVLSKHATVETFDKQEKKRRKFVFQNNSRVEVKPEGGKGTKIVARFDRWDHDQFKEICHDILNVYVKPDKKCVINENEVKNEKPFRTISGELPTKIALKEGQPLSDVKRVTDIDLYDKKSPKADAWLFENGLPIQKQSPRTKWHINVNQKVPLAPTRVSVPNSYYNKLCGVVLNNTADTLEHAESGARWVALGMKYATKATAMKVLTVKLPSANPNNIMLGGSDDMANKACLDAGCGIIDSGTFDSDVLEHLKDMGCVKVAKEEYGGGGKYEADEKIVEPPPVMIEYSNVCKNVAFACLNENIRVRFVKSKRPASAWWQREMKRLTFNLSKLGGADYFNEWNEENVSLLIHELGHHRGRGSYEYEIEHYSRQYVEELQRIGGIIGKVGIKTFFGIIGENNSRSQRKAQGWKRDLDGGT